jgi:hypothetical protein
MRLNVFARAQFWSKSYNGRKLYFLKTADTINNRNTACYFKFILRTIKY